MKKLYWIIPLAFILSVVGFLPSLLSLKIAVPFLEYVLSTKTTKAALRNQSFGWIGPQTIEEVTLSSPSNVTTITKLHAETSFFGLLSKAFGKTSMEGLEITIDGLPKSEQKSSGSISGSFTIKHFFIRERQTALSFRSTNVVFSKEKNRMQAYFNGESTSSFGKGSFSLAADIEAPYFSDKTPFSLQCMAHNLPTDVIRGGLQLIAPQYAAYPEVVLGNALTLSIRCDKTLEDISFSVDGTSPLTTLTATGICTKKGMTLTRGLNLAAKITPEFGALIAPLKGLQLLSPSMVSVSANTLAIPVHKGALEISSAEITGTLNITGGKIQYEKIKHPLSIHSFTTTLRTKNLSQSCTFDGEFQGNYNSSTLSSLSCSLELLTPLSKPEIVTISSKFDGFPLALADTFTSLSLKHLLGARASGILSMNPRKIVGRLNTTRLQTTQFSFEKGDAYTLQSPLKFTYEPRRDVQDVTISPFTLSGEVTSLSVPVDRWQNLEAKAHLITTPFTLDVQNKGVKCRYIEADLSSTKPGVLSLNGQAHLQYTTPDIVQALVPMSVPVVFDGIIDPKNERIPHMHLSVATQNIEADAAFSYAQGNLSLKTPTTISLTPSIELLNGIIVRDTHAAPILRATSPWNIAITNLSLDKQRHLSVGGSIQIQKCTVETQNLTNESTFTSIQSNFNIGEEIRATFESTVNDGHVKGDIEFGKKSSLQLTGKNLPSKTLDTFIGDERRYASFLGKSLDFTASLSGRDICEKGAVRIQSPYISGDVSFTLKGDSYLVSSGSTFTWRMTPEGYQALIEGQPKMRLATPADVSFSMSSYTFPATQKQFFPSFTEALTPLSIQCELSIPSLYFIEIASKKEVILDSFSTSLVRRSPKKPLFYSLTGKAGAKNGKKGNVSLKGALNNFRGSSGKISLANLSFTSEGELSNVPTQLIDALMGVSSQTNVPPSAFFGPTVTCTLDTSIESGRGPLKARFSAATFRGVCDGFVEKGVLYLQKPLQAQIVMTPQLSRALLGSLSVEAVSAESPISLVVSPQGFSLPLFPFTLSKSTVGYAQLDLGKIIVRDVGSTTTVGEIFEVQARAKNIFLWFAPLDFSIANSRMQIQRTEILYDKMYEIALWGGVDLLKEYARLTLGLTAQSLRKALGLSLPQNYVLQVPFKGPLNNVKVDKGAALAKIAFLVARQQGKQSNNVYGNIFGILGDLADDQSTVPPAKHPFPWEK